MRALVSEFHLQSVGSLKEACDLLSKDSGVWRPFAGGTDLMVLFESGKLKHKKFLNLWGLKELKGINEEVDYLSIGALTTYGEVQKSKIIGKEFPLLSLSARETGAVAIQNRGTLGGNIANASPAADSLPVLLVYEAKLELISSEGTRILPYKDFHTDYKKMNLGPDEIISRIVLPRSTATLQSYFRKVGTRKAQAITKVSLAALARVQNGRFEDLRLAMASVAPIPKRLSHVEAWVLANLSTKDVVGGKNFQEKIFEILRKDISPMDDIRSTAEYRLKVASNLIKEALLQFSGSSQEY